MRPNLADVRQWLSAPVISDGQLASYLAVLRADPNWRFTDIGNDFARTLRLLYYPGGAPVDVVLDRVTGGWRPRDASASTSRSLCR